ncbi:MAG: hypothetical protein V3W09_05460 [Nitrososphaerales archaeon]
MTRVSDDAHSGGARVLRLSLPVLLLVPVLFIRAIPRRAIGFTFVKDKVTVPILGLAFTSFILVSLLFSMMVGFYGYLLSFWLIGTAWLVMLVNAATDGLIFIKSGCIYCKLRKIIVHHEKLHLEGIASEREVWCILKETYKISPTIKADGSRICSYCPIPKRLNEN